MKQHELVFSLARGTAAHISDFLRDVDLQDTATCSGNVDECLRNPLAMVEPTAYFRQRDELPDR